MVDGSSYNFLFYEDGIFSDTNCGCDETSLNHAMLLVGYVAYEESQQSYWILKNRSSRVHSIGGMGTYSCAGGASCARRRSARVLNTPRNLLTIERLNHSPTVFFFILMQLGSVMGSRRLHVVTERPEHVWHSNPSNLSRRYLHVAILINTFAQSRTIV